jgi:hypothetical protein
VCLRECVCVRKSVCVRERERVCGLERERVCVLERERVCVLEREYKEKKRNSSLGRQRLRMSVDGCICLCCLSVRRILT